MNDNKNKSGGINPDDYRAILKVEQDNGSNMLVPLIETSFNPTFYKAVVDKVWLSPNPDHGDVYKPDKKKDQFRLKKGGLDKLAICRGLEWIPELCHRTDNRNDDMYVSYQAVASLSKPDGTPDMFIANYDLDMIVIREEIVEQVKYDQYAKSKEAKAAKVEKNFRFKMRHKQALCESGAKTRIMRSVLLVKPFYSQAELRKPFVMLRIVFSPNLKDPDLPEEMRNVIIHALIEKHMGGPKLYSANPRAALPAPAPAIELEYNEVPRSEDEHIDRMQLSGVAKPPTPSEEFESFDKDTKVKILNELVDRKGYDKSLLKKDSGNPDEDPIKTFSKEHLIGFFEHLTALPNK